MATPLLASWSRIPSATVATGSRKDRAKFVLMIDIVPPPSRFVCVSVSTRVGTSELNVNIEESCEERLAKLYPVGSLLCTFIYR
jgi:hypothetical protein